MEGAKRETKRLQWSKDTGRNEQGVYGKGYWLLTGAAGRGDKARSLVVLEGESDLEDLVLGLLDLSAQLVQHLVLLLALRLVVLLAVVSKLVDLQAVVRVLRDAQLLLEPADLRRTHGESILCRAVLRLRGGLRGLHAFN